MSHEGKLRRGEKWYNQRDNNNVLPEGIANDPEKMKDVNYYLENKDKKEETVSEEEGE